MKALRELPDAPRREGLLESWKSLGDAMDLEESREKREYELELERAAERRCSWRECEHHLKKPKAKRTKSGAASGDETSGAELSGTEGRKRKGKK